jgi:DNA-binding transcriptional LysR family regulator
MAKSHPLARRRSIEIADLVDVALIGMPDRTLLRQNLERLFQENNTQPDIRFEATNGVIACELAAQGLGVTLADPFVALSAAAGKSTILPLATEIRLEYGFLYPVGKSRSHASRELTEAMKATAAECLAELGLPATAYEMM